jgi:RHS repeat-associated protein
VDGVGNRTSQTIGTKTTSFTLNSDDQLTATSSSTGGFVNSYTYNNAGDQTNRTLSGTSWTLAYDYEGQLTSTATGGSTVSSFVYDALGRRFSRTNGGTTTKFLYDGAKVLQEKVGGSFTAAYAYGNGLIRKDSEYPMFDGLGSERTVTSSSQTVTGTINHDAFGLTVNTTGSSSNPYKFAANSGYRDDGDAGLTHIGARYYDAQVGRFITRDTYLNQHPYLYCKHDPINRTDPNGHASKFWQAFLGVILFWGNNVTGPTQDQHLIMPPTTDTIGEALPDKEKEKEEKDNGGGSASKIINVGAGAAVVYLGWQVI